MNPTYQTLLRSLLKIGSGYLVSKGLADHDDAELASAGIVALAAIIWGVMHRNVPPAPVQTPVSPANPALPPTTANINTNNINKQ